MEEYIINAKPSDVTPLFVGREACEPGHSFGPYIRDCYIVHFCLKGCGVLKNCDGVFPVTAGRFFAIRPGEITTYTADRDDPWEYVWIAFRTEQTYFEGNRSVFDTPHGLDDRLADIVSTEQISREGCLAVIYNILDHVFRRDENDGDEKIRHIRRYVKYNYMRKISVSSLAESFGFDRSHLYRIFKTRYGIGIKEYITSVRLERGAQFLRDGFSVKETAHMVGYDDEFNFSKAFKARYGISPSRVK